MKRILDTITPPFIKEINERLLKNSILGWQLQLPRILWLWFLLSLIATAIAFIYPLNLIDDNDAETMLGISIFLAVLQFFLYGYILIQFNSSKAFGTRNLFYGLKEQLGYLFVMFLCLTNVIILPFIIECRKSQTISAKTIRKETEVFNKARHYFMDYRSKYKYFPSKQYFFNYTNYTFSYGQERENYYVHTIEPILAPYFTHDSQFKKIDSKYKRKEGIPQLYFIRDEDYLNNYGYLDANYDHKKIQQKLFNYQFGKRSDTEKLNDITAFITLYNKYKELNNYYRNRKIQFEAPKTILKNYNSNQFKVCVKYEDNNDYAEEYEFSLSETINDFHSTILRAQAYKWEHAGISTLICFFVALGFSILFFIFKNVRLKEFILSFVYAGLIALATVILMILTRKEELIGFHMLILIFILGMIMSFRVYNWKYFSSIKLILVIFANIMFAFVPIFIFLYLYEYLNIFRLSHEYCEAQPDLCRAHYDLIDTIRWITLWGGILFYLLVGSILFKKVYEKIFALPLRK